MKTLVFFADISWEGLHQRPHHLASRFADEYTVIWAEAAVLSKRPSFVPVKVRKNLFVVSLPVFPYNARQKWIRTIARVLSMAVPVRSILTLVQSRILRRAIAACGGDERGTVFFFENIFGVRIVDRFLPAGVFYDYIDYLFGFAALPRHVERDWRFLLRRADAVFVTSPTLKRQIESEMHRDAVLVGNGVEFDFFSKPRETRPEDFPDGRPVIGYVGAVYPWLDYELIDRICTELTAMNVVIIGRAHPDVAGRLEHLSRHANFFFLGFREYPAIPSYVQRFTAGIVPFLRNELTEGVNPVKLYEYCAAGVPVVVTDFSPDLASFVPYISIGRTHDEFLSVLRETPRKKADPEHRRAIAAFASGNDWDGKAREILGRMRKEITG